MQLLFSDTLWPLRSLIGSEVTKALTRSRHSHVDFVLDEQTLFGALATKGVTSHSFSERVADARNAVVVDVPLTDEQDKKLRFWLASQDGKKYDWIAALTVLSTHERNWKDENKWMCSELVAAGFHLIGVPLVDDRVIARVVPEDLYRLPLRKRLIKGKL